MNQYGETGVTRDVFGVPAVLTNTERTALLRDLKQLWTLTYGKDVADLENDLELCRRFYDPLARGHTLRERLSQLVAAPRNLKRSAQHYLPPLVVDVGEGVVIVGVEARLMIGLLDQHNGDEDHLVISPPEIATIERRALETYRSWTMGRLNQVVALRSGQGREVMQAISVGLVIALLVNRSDSQERAIVQWDHASPDGKQVDVAIYAGAERFAEAISGSRGGRSVSEQRLKSGYALTEARRRLAHRLAVVRDQDRQGALVYVPGGYRPEVVEFLARDLARRSSLTHETLWKGFDQLVQAFRESSVKLAHRSMVFERAADTAALRRELGELFTQART